MASQIEPKTDERIALEERCAELKGNRKGIFQSSDDKLRETIASLEQKIEPGQEEVAEVEIKKQKIVTAEEIMEITPEELREKSAAELMDIAKQAEALGKAPNTTAPVRKKAPRMNVDNISRDDRTAKVEELRRADPECDFIFQKASITDAELAAKGLERTKHVVKNDIICRTQKEGFVEFVGKKNDANFESMQRIDGGTGIVGSHDSVAKSPKD